jgi:gamma-glutamylcyclotransferase (GGCT)/AIG2-like uncharacterized protein YtfP
MTDERSWWRQEGSSFLNDTLAFINSSRSRGEAIGRCDDLCRALNKTWTAFFQYRSRKGLLNDTEKRKQRSDAQSFRELLLHGLSNHKIAELCAANSIRGFAELTPQIMNHDTLLNEGYDALNITEEMRKKAYDEHRQLLNAFKRLSQSPNDSSAKEAVLKKTAQLIYVVRSNIAHSEKTPHGPDLEKSERDRVVSEATANVIEDIFDILFDRPSHRLAVYGSLAPGGANQSQLAGLEGQWHEGTVKGVVEERGGFSEFHWVLKGKFNPVKVFSAIDLEKHFRRLDRFEGPRYRRILVPVLFDKKQCVCNIYQGNTRDLPAI